MKRAAAWLFLLLMFLSVVGASVAEDDRNALFAQAAENLLSPKELALQSGAYALHTGDSAYVPSVAPEITPFDELASRVTPAVNGSFDSSDESVVTVDENGLMTGVADGDAVVTYHAADGDVSFDVNVSADNLPEAAKAYVYVAKREFYAVKRARLSKYNTYTKWYYGKKKEVGWCSVFTIWCANASGTEPRKEKSVESVADGEIVYFREGQVGNQYDGFSRLGRWTDIPKAGYLVIYADMSNSYKFTHIASVVDVVDRGDGVYQVTTVEGNMSNSIKSYCYLYDSKMSNSNAAEDKKQKLQWNMSELPSEEQTDPLVQYELHTDHWSVFGFGMTWE